MRSNYIRQFISFFFLLAFTAILASCDGGGGSSPAVMKSANITEFSIDNIRGDITGNEIQVRSPYGTNVTALVAKFKTDGVSVTVGGVLQKSESTPNNFTNPVTYVVTAKDGSITNYTVKVIVAPNTAKRLSDFSLNGTPGTPLGTKIEVILPFGTNVTALVASFITDGDSVKVNGVIQKSESTPNNFTNPVTYVVTAADGSMQNYTVNVVVAPSSANSITDFSFTNGTGSIIVGNDINLTVPYGTPVTNLVAQYTADSNNVKVDDVMQTNGETPNDFTNPVIYKVTAANGVTQSYTVKVTVAPNTANSITSFSINGNGDITGNNISVVVPFGANISALVADYSAPGAFVTVNGVTQSSGSTPNDFTNSETTPLVYVVTAANGATQSYMVKVTVALNTDNIITKFSISGNTGVITGESISVVMPYATSTLSGLVADYDTAATSVSVNGTNQISNSTRNDFVNPVTYVVTSASGATKNYTVTVTIAKNSAKSITKYTLNGNPGTIDDSKNTITVTFPYADSARIVDAIADYTTDARSITVNGVAQVKFQTPNNFSSPVTYVATADDGSTKEYTVTVLIALNPANDITAFSLSGTQGVISGNNISVVMPFGTDLSKLVATYTTSGASVAISGTTQTSGQTVVNFTTPITYVVTAANGNTQSYKVTATQGAYLAKNITAFSIGNAKGVFSGNSIQVTVPYDTNVTELVATYTTDGSNNGVSVNGIMQTSKLTPNNFSTPLTYIVKATDNSTESYLVTVVVAPNSDNTITQFSLDGYGGDITGNSIVVTIPYTRGSDVGTLIATYTTVGSVSVNGVGQISGTTSNDFSNGSLPYLVTAANGESKLYTVSVIVAPNTAKNITAFIIDGYEAVITETDIDVSIPANSKASAIATFITTGESVYVNGKLQVSGQTTNNFTFDPVTYVVYAADGSTKSYNVHVSTLASADKIINTFSLNRHPGVITGNTISVNVPDNTNLTNAVASFVGKFASVSVGGIQQVSATTQNNFTNQVIYTVKAADGTSQNYTVTATKNSSYVMTYYPNYYGYFNNNTAPGEGSPGHAIAEASYVIPGIHYPYPRFLGGAIGAVQTTTNDDLIGKLAGINALSYGFFKLDVSGSIQFSDPYADLGTTGSYPGVVGSRDAALYSMTLGKQIISIQGQPALLDGNVVHYGGFDAFIDLVKPGVDKLDKFVSVGGWDGALWSQNLSSTNQINTFVASVQQLNSIYPLDGIDLDIENTPSAFPNGPQQFYAYLNNNAMQLITALNTALPNLKITLTIQADPLILNAVGTQLAANQSKIFAVQLMTYDFHGTFDCASAGGVCKTGLNSSLLPPTGSPFTTEFSVSGSVDTLMQYLPANKISLGIPAYGRAAITNVPSANQGLFQPISFTNSKVMPGDLDTTSCSSNLGQYGTCSGTFEYRYLYGLSSNYFAVTEIYESGYYIAATAYGNPVIATPKPINGIASVGIASNYPNNNPSDVFISYVTSNVANSYGKYALSKGLKGMIMWDVMGDLPYENPRSLLSTFKQGYDNKI